MNGSEPAFGVPPNAELALVTLDRPDEMNPLDHDAIRTLRAALADLDADPRVRAVAITGAGRAFSAGGDMKKYRTLQRDPIAFPVFLEDFHTLLTEVGAAATPVLALVNGVAVAGGIELLLSCDFAVAAESARIGDGHLPFGQMGGGGSLTLLPRVVGPSRARELVFTGRTLPAAEALEWGLVSRVVPDDDLRTAGIEIARGLAARSPLAVANAKRTLNASYWEGTAIGAGLRLERETAARYCLTSTDAHEGLAAFAEKRSPQFSGR
ncbi:enoyl-CoA hydratase/isomerase family protein [Pseudonocardia yuanmonensis]|uniref:enoyl-CoA hydratase/isomerase family protein n=1 Tax=Pseudonocardia yuanmonensis TaxID=1095914 RepID=UPI0031E5DEA2